MTFSGLVTSGQATPLLSSLYNIDLWRADKSAEGWLALGGSINKDGTDYYTIVLRNETQPDRVILVESRELTTNDLSMTDIKFTSDSN